VQILQRDYATGRIAAQQPESDPKYMGVPALLLSEVLWPALHSSSSHHGTPDEKRRLAAKN